MLVQPTDWANRGCPAVGTLTLYKGWSTETTASLRDAACNVVHLGEMGTLQFDHDIVELLMVMCACIYSYLQCIASYLRKGGRGYFNLALLWIEVKRNPALGGTLMENSGRIEVKFDVHVDPVRVLDRLDSFTLRAELADQLQDMSTVLEAHLRAAGSIGSGDLQLLSGGPLFQLTVLPLQE
eukprot:1824170-Amphidinium_carterae.1